MTLQVFVTGASGFLGRAVSARLRADGHMVRGVDRAADAEHEVVAGDVAEPGPWQAAVAGCDLVVHTAAVVSNVVGADEQWRTNVLGTRRVLDAAVRARAQRFLHLSSVRAFGDSGYPDGADESWPVRPDGNPYVDTKVASEQVVLQAHAAGEVVATVARPGDVYGPGSRPWTLLPLEAARAGQLVLPARGRGVFTPVYVDDLVDGLVRAGTDERAAGQVLTLSGPRDVTCAEFFGHYARMLGRPLRTVPTPVALVLAGAVGRVDRLRGRESEVNAATMRYLARTGGYSRAKAERLLGWVPEVELGEGMRRTEQWLREQGLM